MVAPASNPWEAKARLAKADRLVDALDPMIRGLGFDPHRDGADIAEGLRKWPASQWAELAVTQGAKPPSPITIGVILDRYEQRARAHAAGRVPCAICTDGSCHLCDDYGLVPPPGFDDEDSGVRDAKTAESFLLPEAERL